MAKPIKEKEISLLPPSGYRCANCGYEVKEIENPACPIACPKCRAGRMVEIDVIGGDKKEEKI